MVRGELQVAIEAIDMGDINMINPEIKEVVNTIFPGSFSDQSAQDNARNALQQTLDQLENGDINSISSTEIQTALRIQFPGLESTSTDGANSELNAAISELNNGGINAIANLELRDFLRNSYGSFDAVIVSLLTSDSFIYRKPLP